MTVAVLCAALGVARAPALVVQVLLRGPEGDIIIIIIIIIILSLSSPEGGGSTGPGSEARSQTPGLDLDQGAEPALTNIPLLRARRE